MKTRVSRRLSKKVKQAAVKDQAGWDQAIRDAEDQINIAKHRIDVLTLSVGRFKEFRDSGEPWPGGRAEQPQSDVAA